MNILDKHPTTGPEVQSPVNHTPVTVWIPNDRLAAFHATLTNFYSNVDRFHIRTSDKAVAAGSQEACNRWWLELTKKERSVWALLVERSPQMISNFDIMKELALESVRILPGILSWSRRKGATYGWPVEWTKRKDPRRDGSTLYGIVDPFYAAMILQARNDASSILTKL